VQAVKSLAKNRSFILLEAACITSDSADEKVGSHRAECFQSFSRWAEYQFLLSVVFYRRDPFWLVRSDLERLLIVLSLSLRSALSSVLITEKRSPMPRCQMFPNTCHLIAILIASAYVHAFASKRFHL
jgi:hypothetical protein